jgi:hypothetical protein
MDDRYKMVESLREAGFTKQQAELILKIVQDAMNASRVTATELVRSQLQLRVVATTKSGSKELM